MIAWHDCEGNLAAKYCGRDWRILSSPQTLTHLGGAKYIAWRLRRPFLGKCRRSPRYSCAHQAFLGYSPVSRPTQNSVLCQTHLFGWVRNKCIYIYNYNFYVTIFKQVKGQLFSHFWMVSRIVNEEIILFDP